MGCAQSKIENEEAVTRCKERKQLMREAVIARNAFAAAHSAYAMALKNTGAALSDYSHGEFLVSSSGVAAAITSTSSLPTAISPPTPPPPPLVSDSSSAAAAIQPPVTDTLQPPPPPHSLLPLQRAATMPPEMNGRSGGPISNGIDEDGTLDDDGDDSELENRLVRKSKSRGGASNRGRKMIDDEEEKALPPPPAANSRPIPPQHQHLVGTPWEEPRDVT